MLVRYTAKCNLYCRLCNLEFIVLTNELDSKGIINEHINYPPQKKKLETRLSFRPLFLSSAIWLVDFSAHGSDKVKVLMKSETGQLLHTALSNSLPKQSISLVGTVCRLLLTEQKSWKWFFFSALFCFCVNLAL